MFICRYFISNKSNDRELDGSYMQSNVSSKQQKCAVCAILQLSTLKIWLVKQGPLQALWQKYENVVAQIESKTKWFAILKI